MKVTIFGATGLLGSAVMRQWTIQKPGDNITGLSSKDADIRDLTQVNEAVKRYKPDWIVLLAAYTDVDGCETNRDLAFAVNARGAANVAEAAKQAQAKMLFISSDYVFDGAKRTPYEADDPVNPHSVYGQSKAAAESLIRNILPEGCIVRTSWLYGIGGKCFPDTILNLAATRPAIDVVNDQRGSPTHADDLASAIIQLCHADAKGVIHATNRGDCTWFDLASEIVSHAHLNTVVRPTTSDKFVRPAPRPAYSVLSPPSLQKYGIALPDWKSALQSYLKQRITSDNS